MNDALLADLAARARSKYYGKYRGFVMDADDPEQLGRVKLQIPSLLGDQITGWALPCVPFGGSPNVGWFAIPEVGAQVWIEFEEGDLRRPIWTGTFWRRQGDAPKDAQKSPPTTRLLQTPSGHVLQLDDASGAERIRLHHAAGAELVIDERGTITVTDRAGNALKLDADASEISLVDANGNAATLGASGIKLEDAHRNAIELGASGVTIRSASQIVLDANVVMLGGAGGEPLLKGSSFLTLFATHVHTASGPGAPTSPPIPQGEPTTLSTAVQTR
jgi:uncharacterized protein involved in type VI secretion and phage assembly